MDGYSGTISWEDAYRIAFDIIQAVADRDVSFVPYADPVTGCQVIAEADYKVVEEDLTDGGTEESR